MRGASTVILGSAPPPTVARDIFFAVRVVQIENMRLVLPELLTLFKTIFRCVDSISILR
jgi:hypothetical protein